MKVVLLAAAGIGAITSEVEYALVIVALVLLNGRVGAPRAFERNTRYRN